MVCRASLRRAVCSSPLPASSTAATAGPCSSSSAIALHQLPGNPLAKPTVPSMASISQRRPVPCVLVPSSPRIASSGRNRPIVCAAARSATASASVTRSAATLFARGFSGLDRACCAAWAAACTAATATPRSSFDDWTSGTQGIYDVLSIRENKGEALVIGILIAILLAAVVYALCVALGLPSIVAIIAAILVLLAGIPSGGYGLGGRWGGRRGVCPRGPATGRPPTAVARSGRFSSSV